MPIDRIIVPAMSRVLPTREPYSTLHFTSLGYEIHGEDSPELAAALRRKQLAQLDELETMAREKYGTIAQRPPEQSGTSARPRIDYKVGHGVPGIPAGDQVPKEHLRCLHPSHPRSGGRLDAWGWNFSIAQNGFPACKAHNPRKTEPWKPKDDAWLQKLIAAPGSQ